MDLQQKILNVLAFCMSSYVQSLTGPINEDTFRTLIVRALNVLVDAREIGQGVVIRADSEFVEVKVHKIFPYEFEVFRFETGSIVDLASVSFVMNS